MEIARDIKSSSVASLRHPFQFGRVVNLLNQRDEEGTQTVGFGPRFKIFIFILGSGLAIFLPFYFSFNPYKSKSFIPQLLGIIGSCLMLFGATVYAIRKRVRFLKNFGRMTQWLNAHVVLCTLGPLLITYHTAFSIKSPNAAVCYYSMLIVFASGIMGRFIYKHFQFSLSGEKTTIKEMKAWVERLDEKIYQTFPEPEKMVSSIKKFFAFTENKNSRGFVRLFIFMILLDFKERRLKRQITKSLRKRGPLLLKRSLSSGTFEPLLIKRISLEKKIFALEGTSKLFGYWHRLHIPFLWMLALTLLFHILAVTIF